MNNDKGKKIEFEIANYQKETTFNNYTVENVRAFKLVVSRNFTTKDEAEYYKTKLQEGVKWVDFMDEEKINLLQKIIYLGTLNGTLSDADDKEIKNFQEIADFLESMKDEQ